MQWQHHQASDEYTLHMGDCLALVRRTTVSNWQAEVASQGVARGRDNFAHLADAQAWCVTELVRQKGDGKC